MAASASAVVLAIQLNEDFQLLLINNLSSPELWRKESFVLRADRVQVLPKAIFQTLDGIACAIGCDSKWQQLK